MGLTNKQRVFIDEYLKDCNATQAALRAGYSEKGARVRGSELLANRNISEAIKERLDRRAMEADEVLSRLTQMASSDMGNYFQLIEEWTFYPLPSYDIIGQKEIEILDEDGKKTGEKKISYWVRHVTIDMDKIIDPKYSHLIKKFTDSPKNGLGVELYDAHAALVDLAKYHGLFVDRTDINVNAEVNNKSTIIIKGVDYRTIAANLAPRPIQDSDTPGEGEDTFNGTQMG
jgi:phage terminase small subunit